MKFYANDSNVTLNGRVLQDKNTVYLGWSGSAASFTFTGKKATAVFLSDPEAWGEKLLARIAVFVDEEEIPSKRICLNEKEQTVTLFESEEERTVTVKVMKLSEAAFAYCGIEYFEIDTEKLEPACSKAATASEKAGKSRRRIEIIGDSITCGYGVEAPNELTSFDTETENPLKSYSLLLAKALDAEVNLVCWSGNGLTSHYVDPSATEPRNTNLMPELYRYTDKSLSERLYGSDETKWEKWNFDNYVPEVIFINLGTNDCSWCREIPERNDAFKAEYIKFLEYIREHNPNAKIISMLGTMDTRLKDTMPVTVEEYKAKSNDMNIAYIELPVQTPEIDGYGADYHPSPSSQKKTCEFILNRLKEIC